MVNPPRWDEARLEQDRQQAISLFRGERLEEPVELYTSLVDEQQGIVEELLEKTVNLGQLDDEVVKAILEDVRYQATFRYLAGPPISEDDWKVLAEVRSLAPSQLRNDSEASERLKQVVLNALDRRRFPWVSENREATEAERNAAALATACLRAYQQTQKERRLGGKRLEGATADRLKAAGLTEVAKRDVNVIRDMPGAGEFCGETSVASRRADFVVGMADGRYALIECKESNSEVNSIKRLNNDTAAKASFWLERFGNASVVPIAVIAGVFSLESLMKAQEVGLHIFWGHAMDEFQTWLEAVSESG